MKQKLCWQLPCIFKPSLTRPRPFETTVYVGRYTYIIFESVNDRTPTCVTVLSSSFKAFLSSRHRPVQHASLGAWSSTWLPSSSSITVAECVRDFLINGAGSLID